MSAPRWTPGALSYDDGGRDRYGQTWPLLDAEGRAVPAAEAACVWPERWRQLAVTILDLPVSRYVEPAPVAGEIVCRSWVKLLVYGSRTWAPTLTEIERGAVALLGPLGITRGDVRCVVSGRARGADSAGEAWAAACGFEVDPYPAAWRRPDGTTDMTAGRRRNAVMAQVATHAVGFRDHGKSNGTDHMTDLLRERGTPHLVVRREDAVQLQRG